MRIPIDRIIEKLDDILSRNDYINARKHLEYWLSEAQSEEDKRGELTVCNELIGLHRKCGNKEEAMINIERALNLVKELDIEQSIGGATTFVNSATAYKAFSMAEKSMPLFEKAEEIYKTNLEKGDARLGGLYNNMALALVDLKRFEEAKDCYEKAIENMKLCKRGELEIAITYLNLAGACEEEKGLEEGNEEICKYCELAMPMLDKYKDSKDGYYAFVLEKCATVFSYYGYFAYSNEISERAKAIYERD